MTNPSENNSAGACPDFSGLGTPRTGPHWTCENIPDLSGKRALVTGGAGGLGLATVRALAAHGAEVIIADVNRELGEAAARDLPRCAYRSLDLSKLQSIEAFAEPLVGKPLDILINLAGIYPPAQAAQTSDGLDLGMAINFWGHFALTGYLLPALLKADKARVVSISSITQAWGKLDFATPQTSARYQADKVYACSKLACLMFGLALHERAQAAQSNLQSMIAHPGIARTTLGQERKQKHRGIRARMEDAAQAFAMRFFGQGPEQGALPILFAATAPEAKSGGFYGPHGLGQFSGFPISVQPSKLALNQSARQQLWLQAQHLSHCEYPF